MNYWSIAKFLTHTVKSTKPLDFTHEEQMRIIEKNPCENLLRLIQSNEELSTDYMNGVYFGLCLAAASSEERFVRMVHRIEEEEEKRKFDGWKIEKLGKLP